MNGIVLLNREEEKRYLEILNKFFPTEPFEKHPTAMLSVIFDSVLNEVLGKGYSKKKISQRKSKIIKEKLIKKLRSRYGRYINLTHMKIKDTNNIKFLTNFNAVYKVKGQGILYASPSYSVCRGIFYTSHSLERFEERTDTFLYEPVVEELRKYLRTEPTAADVIISLISRSPFEYSQDKDLYYLNIITGVLVLQGFEDIFIAKTYLSPDMLNQNIQWYRPLLSPEEDKSPINYFDTFSEIFKHERFPVQKPEYLEDLN